MILASLFFVPAFAEDNSDNWNFLKNNSPSPSPSTDTDRTPRWSSKFDAPKNNGRGELGTSIDAPLFSQSDNVSNSSVLSAAPPPAAVVIVDSADAPRMGAAPSPLPSASGSASEVPGRWKRNYDDEVDRSNDGFSTKSAKSLGFGGKARATKSTRPGEQTIQLKNGQTVTGIVYKEDKQAQGYWVDEGEGIKIFLGYDEIGPAEQENEDLPSSSEGSAT